MVPHTKVFVGNLPPGSKPEDLRKLFERFGVVTECDIMNRCGFVHMQTEDQATAAIRGLHYTSFNGALLSVERGRYKERGARGGGRGGRGGGPMRGAPYGRGGGGGYMGGRGGRDAPYMRERPSSNLRELRGVGGGAPAPAMRNGLGGYGEERYGGYGEDRRGFALMEAREPYVPPYEERRYEDPYMEARAPLYDERDMLDRRRAPPPYDRAPPMPNGDMYSRREPMPRGGGGYDRDPYAQQYPPMGRGSGGAPRSGGMGPRRY